MPSLRHHVLGHDPVVPRPSYGVTPSRQYLRSEQNVAVFPTAFRLTEYR